MFSFLFFMFRVAFTKAGTKRTKAGTKRTKAGTKRDKAGTKRTKAGTKRPSWNCTHAGISLGLEKAGPKGESSDYSRELLENPEGAK